MLVLQSNNLHVVKGHAFVKDSRGPYKTAKRCA